MTTEGGQSGHRLIIRQELRLAGTVDLQGPSLLVGRSPQCQIRLQHEAVSRHHARVEKRPDGWYVVDLESVNGLRVNGRRVKESLLTLGDVIEIRPFAINYLAEGQDFADQSISLSASRDSPTLVRGKGGSGQLARRRGRPSERSGPVTAPPVSR
jgi:pSer/pThr/pTyr-binding forkhead associated (FHA) protein